MVKALDVSDIKEISTSAIPAGIECGGGDSPGSLEHVTSIEVRLVKEKETTSSIGPRQSYSALYTLRKMTVFAHLIDEGFDIFGSGSHSEFLCVVCYCCTCTYIYAFH